MGRNKKFLILPGGSKKTFMYIRPGREWRAIARARAHTRHISLRRANMAHAKFIKNGLRRAIIALASLKERSNRTCRKFRKIIDYRNLM